MLAVVLLELTNGLFFLGSVLGLHLLVHLFSLGVQFLEDSSLFFNSGVSELLSLAELLFEVSFAAGLSMGKSLLKLFLDGAELLWGGSFGVGRDAEGDSVGLFGLDLELHI